MSIAAERHWPRSDLLWQVIRRDLRSRNRRTVLGIFWVILGPLLATSVVVISLSGIFAGSLGGFTSYAVYTLSGVVFVQFTSFGLSGVSNSISSARGIVSKISTPSMLFPLASLISSTITWSVTTVYVILANLIVTGSRPTLLLIPAFVCYAAFLFGIGLLVSAVNVHYEDATSVLPIVVQGLTFLTPVFYSAEIWPPGVAAVLSKNPIYWFLQLYRAGVGVEGPPPGSTIAWAVAVTIAAVALGILAHRRLWPNLVRRL